MTEQQEFLELTIEQITEILAAKGYIASLWHVEDVKTIRPDLNEEQSLEVLQACERYHDAGIGINWHVIEHHAKALFPKPKEQGGE